MAKITMTIDADSAVELREEMAKILYNCTVAQLNQPAAEPGVFVAETSAGPADEAVKPEPKKRASRAKAEDRAPEGVMSPDPVIAATPAGRTTEAFVDQLKAMRAKYGEAIIPKIRTILGKYKTDKGEECLKGSDIQLKDVEAAIADLEKLAETEDNDI